MFASNLFSQQIVIQMCGSRPFGPYVGSDVTAYVSHPATFPDNTVPYRPAYILQVFIIQTLCCLLLRRLFEKCLWVSVHKISNWTRRQQIQLIEPPIAVHRHEGNSAPVNCIRVAGRPSLIDASCLQMQEKQNVIGKLFQTAENIVATERLPTICNAQCKLSHRSNFVFDAVEWKTKTIGNRFPEDMHNSFRAFMLAWVP